MSSLDTELAVAMQSVNRYGKRLAELETERAQFKRQIAQIRIEAAGIQLKRSYLHFSQLCRLLVDKSIIWRPGAALIAVTLVAGVSIAVSQSPVVAVVIAAFVLAISCATLFVTRDDFLRLQIQELNSQYNTSKTRIDECRRRLLEASSSCQDVRYRLGEAKERVHAIRASKMFRLTELARADWRGMRGVDFEQFLEQVFTELGYRVETTKTTGDQGVDLILVLRECRIAVQVKGYADSVGNGAVQEIHAGKAHYSCHASAVITNSRFTRGATELAVSVDCVLIDEETLPQLIIAEIDLWELCFRRRSDEHVPPRSRVST